jgi:hypothetical protein
VAAEDARADVAPGHDTGLRADRHGLENARYRVTLNEAGQVTSIVDKEEGERELLSGPIEHQFLGEHPRIFPAWNMEWRDRKRPPVAVLEGPAQIEVVEAGPVRASVRITRTHGDSRFQQEVRLACGGAGERVEFADTIDWRETGCSFKAAFPLTVSAAQASYNWELGVIRRGNNDSDKFEVPAHRWFDLTDADGAYGVTVLEDCKYGSDKPADDVLRLTLLFTPRIGPLDIAFRDQGSQDWGRHRMLYGLYGHRGDWRAGGSERQSLRLNQPPLVFRVPAAPGPLGRSYSFLQVDSAQVGVRAIKRAEEGEAVVVRLQELWGQESGEVTVRAGDGVRAAWETDGCERRLGEATVVEGRLVTQMGPFAVRTFELELSPVGVAGADLGTPGSGPAEDATLERGGPADLGAAGSSPAGGATLDRGGPTDLGKPDSSPAGGATPPPGGDLREGGGPADLGTPGSSPAGGATLERGGPADLGTPGSSPAGGATPPPGGDLREGGGPADLGTPGSGPSEDATLDRGGPTDLGAPGGGPTGLAYASLALPSDVQVYTGDDERERGGLPGGRSYPRELVPRRVMCCGVPLEMAVARTEQAVTCRGQAIDLPEGAWETLLLLASADEAQEVTLYVDEAAHRLHVGAGEGFVGLGDRRIWDRPMEKERDYFWRAVAVGLEPGYVRRDRIGWYTTHMHSREGNEAYAYGYAFLYSVPLSPGARTLRLPEAPGVRILAATACRGALVAEPAAALYDEMP